MLNKLFKDIKELSYLWIITVIIVFPILFLIYWGIGCLMSTASPNYNKSFVTCYSEGRLFYSANGQYNKKNNSLVEDGTHDLVLLSNDCIIRMK